MTLSFEPHAKTCWMCGSEDVVYTDVLRLGWCDEHYREFYLDEGGSE